MKPGDYSRLLLLAAIWGASFLLMRVLAPQFGAINTAFLRVAIGLIGLVSILLYLRTHGLFKQKFKQSLLLGVINSGCPFLLYALAAPWLPVGYSVVINAMTPLMGVMLGLICFAESFSLKKIIGVILGLIGIGFLTTRGSLELTLPVLLSISACLLATLCYALASFLTKRWITDVDARLVAMGSQLGATLFLLPFFAYSLLAQPIPIWPTPMAWLSMLALGLICTSFAYLLYFRLITDIGPLRSLTVTFLIPPFGILWGYLILGEQPSQGMIGGGILIFLATVLILSTPSNPQRNRPI